MKDGNSARLIINALLAILFFYSAFRQIKYGGSKPVTAMYIIFGLIEIISSYTIYRTKDEEDI